MLEVNYFYVLIVRPFFRCIRVCCAKNQLKNRGNREILHAIPTGVMGSEIFPENDMDWYRAQVKQL